MTVYFLLFFSVVNYITDFLKCEISLAQLRQNLFGDYVLSFLYTAVLDLLMFC